MAIIFGGLTTCAICNKVLYDLEDIYGFQPFIPNVKDKLYLFNDAGCHKSCIDNHPYGKEVIDFSNEIHLNFKQKKCWATGNVITKMEDFFGLPLLTSERLEPLYKYNFLTLDKNNIANWKEKEYFIATVSNFIAAGKWQDLTEEYKFWDVVMKEIRTLG